MKTLACAAVLVVLGTAAPAPAGWDAQAYRDLGTLELLTVGPEEGEHWSTVWLVVLDGDVYVRLGTRAAGRMEKNATSPFVKMRIGGEEFGRVRAEAVPEMAERVAEAMADKYWSDVLVRFFSHPLTMRLTPDE